MLGQSLSSSDPRVKTFTTTKLGSFANTTEKQFFQYSGDAVVPSISMQPQNKRMQKPSLRQEVVIPAHGSTSNSNSNVKKQFLNRD